MSPVEQETTAEWFTLLNYITLVLDLVICLLTLVGTKDHNEMIFFISFNYLSGMIPFQVIYCSIHSPTLLDCLLRTGADFCHFPLDLSSFLLFLPNELIFQGTLSQYLSFSYESTAHFVIHLHAISYHLLPTSEENPAFKSCWSLLIFSTKFNIYITKTERQKKSAFSYLYY